MIPVYLDMETFWSTTHTLSKMSPMAYVMHPETEIISCAAKVGNEPTYVTFGEEAIKKQFAAFDWSDKLVIAHNNEGFDSMIIAWRLGVKPKMWGCTLAMARPHHAKTAGGSLKALAEHYGLQAKDNTALLNTKGRHLKDFTEAEIASMREYNKIDTEICASLFKILAKKTSPDEMKLIDMTIRMLVEPQFVVDRRLLAVTLDEERERKRDALLQLAAKLGIDGLEDDELIENARAQLASAPKFAAFLEAQGVEVPMKVSPATGKQAPALAKTDEEFLALKEHDNPLVAAATMARLDVKSTLLETRLDAFIQASDASGGKLPVPLKYYGADTTGRWSGWAYNPQNMPRVPRNKDGSIIDKPTNALRMCLRAPKGYKVIVADLSGIELRVNHFLWKVPSSMELFQADPEKADLYKEFASSLYGVPKKEVTKDQRQVGKVAHLGLGFGAGPATFKKVAKLMAGIDMPQDEADQVVSKWREAYVDIVEGWKACHKGLPHILSGEAGYKMDPWGMCVTTKEGIKTPRGMIRYPHLRKESSDGKTEWFYGEGRHKARIYAGKITENIVQHLARCIIADNALEFKKKTGLTLALTCHDELCYVVPESDAAERLAELQSIMRTPPSWWPELVVWSEGDVADTYGEGK